MRTAGNFLQHAGARAQLLHRIGQRVCHAGIGDFQIVVQPRLADARVQHRRFPARIGADQQQRVRCFDALECRVEEIGLTRSGRQLRAILPAIEVGNPEAAQQILQRFDLFRRGKVTSDGRNLLACRPSQL
jgi:hypothetical protein